MRNFFSAFVIKELVIIVAAKNYKQRLVHSPLTTSGLQTPRNFYLDISKKLNVI